MAENAIAEEGGRGPSLHPFITLRDEHFGALVFNPYTGAERSFAAAESDVIRNLDGRRDQVTLSRIIASRHGFPPDQAAAIVGNTLTALRGLHALDEEGGDAGRPAPAAAPACGATPACDGILSAPKSAIWELTRACNLECVHCLARGGEDVTRELDLPQLLRIVDILEEARVLRLFLSGGEPFVSPWILPLIERLSETNIYFDLGTNGFDVPEEFFRNLDTYRLFLVQVSIDGIGDRHDAFRRRKGAFAAAARTIRRLSEAGVDVTISTTATAENLDQIEGIIDFALQTGCAGFKAIGFVAAGRGNANASRLKLTRDQYRALAALLVRKQAELAGTLSVETGTTMSFLLEPRALDPAPAREAGPKRLGCAAGSETLYIAADGTAYPCPFFRDFPLGNCLQTPLTEIWRNAPFLTYLRTLTDANVSEECRACPHLGAGCNAGCRASAYLASGDLCGMDPSCFRERAPA